MCFVLRSDGILECARYRHVSVSTSLTWCNEVEAKDDTNSMH